MADHNTDNKTPASDMQSDKVADKTKSDSPKKEEVIELDNVTLDDVVGGGMQQDCNGNCNC